MIATKSVFLQKQHLRLMNIKIFFMGLIGFFSAICGCADSSKIKSVDPDEFEQIIQDTAVVRLDVRTAEEYAEGHIAHSLNIDITQNNFRENALRLLPKEKVIAVYCRSGRRSKKAAIELKELGFDIVELDKGYNSWTGAHKPIEYLKP